MTRQKNLGMVWLSAVLITLAANCYLTIRSDIRWIWPALAALLLGNLLPLVAPGPYPNVRMRLCSHGNLCLRAFRISVLISVVWQLGAIFAAGHWLQWVWSVLVCVCVEALLFWNGMISVYATSWQLGIGNRLWGALLGLVPVANLVMLFRIIRITGEEVAFETARQKRDLERKEQQICATKYPILMVHGVFFRDFRYFNYWGRIPAALEANGARIYYGNHQSADAVRDSAGELAARIKEILAETGCEKVNIIAHSKGGLDCRYAMAYLGMAPYVASLTTINTPHRGCQFADYLLEQVSETFKNQVADTYNSTLKKLGDPEPDFLSAVYDLTHETCGARDLDMPEPEGVLCQSVGSRQNRASGGKFPMNFSYHLVKHFDGENDGLVGKDSFAWGQRFLYVTTDGKRGISHGDMVDLNRENIPDFDVREFYVNLVAELKEKGL